MPLFLSLVLLSSSASPCESTPEAGKALQAFREASPSLAYTERTKALESLAARFTSDFEIQWVRLQDLRDNFPKQWPSARDAYVGKAESGNPLALTLAAGALFREDTPRSLALLDKAGAYPWAAVLKAEIYVTGRFKDPDKAHAAFDAYLRACPDRLDSWAGWVMTKAASPETQPTFAKALRARLEHETDPAELRGYERLWGLEFRFTPPAQHPDLRKRVAVDLDRITALRISDKKLASMLLSGAKQAGKPPAEITALEDGIVKDYPASSAAYGIVYNRWKKAHPEPEDQKDKAAWARWNEAYYDALGEWAPRFTEVTFLPGEKQRVAIDLGKLTGDDAVRAIEQSLEKDLNDDGPQTWIYYNAAMSLSDEHLAPQRVLELLSAAWPLAEVEDATNLRDDTLDAREREERSDWDMRSRIAGECIKAACLAGKTQVPAAVRNHVEKPLPAQKHRHSSYYNSRAQLALLDGKPADALAYFQAALFLREKPPGAFRGQLKDDLLDDARDCYMKTGGTETAFQLWSKPPSGTTQLAEGRWEKPTKALPAFELSDLQGKTWKLKQLEGKVVLINLWATWCGPCRRELPRFQKLYEQTKDRTDLQVITFNIDEELGLVEPFMKENNYTFPVLQAFSFTRQLLDDIFIPQNWLIDSNGKWLSTQFGFDVSDMDWVKSMVAKLETARDGKPSL